MKIKKLMRRHGTLVRACSALLLLVAAFLIGNTTGKIVLCAAATLLAGADVLWQAMRNILHGDVFDENFLMCIAAIGAFCIGEYHEAAAVMIFYQVGEYFQSRAVRASRADIRALMDIRPEIAHLLDGTDVRDVEPETLRVGQTIRILPGERVPVDVCILSGESWIDTTALSGESIPRQVMQNDSVFGGSVNVSGLLTARVQRVYTESAVSRMLALVEDAADKKAKTENFITTFARYYTPAVVLVAALLALVPPVFAGHFSDWLYRALVFLVVSCPCALVISVPLGFFGGIGGAARRGILVKGGNFLEALARVDTVLFDKTGTLTRGSFDVRRIVADNLDEQTLLALAAHAEYASPHPLAKAIVARYNGAINAARVSNVQELSGRGAQAVVDGKTVCVGRRQWIAQLCGAQPPQSDYAAAYVCVDGTYCGYIEVADTIKDDAKDAVRALRRAGVRRIVMLTGDKQHIADAVGTQLGLDQVYAGLLPDQKVERAQALMQDGGVTAFVGDGMNDAPLLARVDVGIAMGALGSDAAIEAADVVIMNDAPSKIAEAIAIAKKTTRIVRQNVILSLAIKFAVLLLAAFGIVGMWTAVFADVGVAMLAILNSMRTLRVRG
jgi:Cd2+/Zn2+-exporting ATPase